jgi:hypothetical protein
MVRWGWGCGSSRCGSILGSFLFTRLDGQMMPDGATGNGAEHRVMMREMARHRADHRALHAPGISRNSSARKHQSGKHSGNRTTHLILRRGRNGP